MQTWPTGPRRLRWQAAACDHPRWVAGRCCKHPPSQVRPTRCCPFSQSRPRYLLPPWLDWSRSLCEGGNHQCLVGGHIQYGGWIFWLRSFRDFASQLPHHSDPVAFKTFVVLSCLGIRPTKASVHTRYFPTVETVVVEICELGYGVVWVMLVVINLDTVRTRWAIFALPDGLCNLSDRDGLWSTSRTT